VHHAAPPFLQRGRQRSAGQVTRRLPPASFFGKSETYMRTGWLALSPSTPARTGMPRGSYSAHRHTTTESARGRRHPTLPTVNLRSTHPPSRTTSGWTRPACRARMLNGGRLACTADQEPRASRRAARRGDAYFGTWRSEKRRAAPAPRVASLRSPGVVGHHLGHRAGCSGPIGRISPRLR
jgi:hypothetical protein